VCLLFNVPASQPLAVEVDWTNRLVLEERYDDNITELSSRDLDRLTRSGGGTGEPCGSGSIDANGHRFSITTPDDLISIPQLSSTLRAGWLAGKYRERRYRAYVGRLEMFRDTDPFHFRPLAGSLFQTALRQDREARRVHCRTLDRLHLAAMEELGLRRLMTTDTAEAAGAKALGFEVVSPGRH
jgi:predicted nucleic acid-binding protein